MENTVCPPYRLNFNPRSPHGERRAVKSLSGATNEISTHAPRTGSDTRTERQGAEAMHFNPRSPHGERRGRGCFSDGKVCRFQPTLPARGATVAPLQRVAHVLISTHAPRTGSDDQGADTYESFAISTHAPRTGSDVLLCCVCRSPRHFNPRSPHGERRGDSYDVHEPRRFQPTLPARGATRERRSDAWQLPHFNPRSPHGERHIVDIEKEIASKFQPTLPARGATRRPPMKPAQSVYFNPRSPHGERRAAAAYADSLDRDFNPRSPHGERLHQQSDFWLRSKFQPTLPARGATLFIENNGQAIDISTHAPRTGSDAGKAQKQTGKHGDFNPRSPHGERRKICMAQLRRKEHFNPRSPHGERQTASENLV